MVFIYAPDATPTECATNGYGILQAMSCEVYEEINGAFYVKIKIPQGSTNSEYFLKDAIIKCPTHRGVQQFRLDGPSRTLDELYATAWHITYDLAKDIIMEEDWSAKTGSQVLPLLLASGTYETRFDGMSTNTTVNNLVIIRGSILSAIMDVPRGNCFLTKYGGEIDRDNYTFNIPTSIGMDNGLRVAYKKNLVGMRIDENTSKIATRIIPTCLAADDTFLLLTEEYIDSDNIDEYPYPLIKTIHYSDIKVGKVVDGDTPYPTEASAMTEMRTRVAALYAAGVDLPIVSVAINFVLLADLKEYEEYADLEVANLGDTVKGGYLGYIFNHRIISITYDSLHEKMIGVVLGSVKDTFAGTIYSQDVSLSALTDRMNGALMQGEGYNEVSISHDDGFKSTATVGGKAIETKMNATDGISIEADGTKVFGVDVEGHQFSESLSDSEDPDFKAIVGTRVDGAETIYGIHGYLKDRDADPEEWNHVFTLDIWRGEGYFVNLMTELGRPNFEFVSLGGTEGQVAQIGYYDGSDYKYLEVNEDGFYKVDGASRTAF
jgi:phage minor structural protein